jgi:RHS repeat-associated protein
MCALLGTIGPAVAGPMSISGQPFVDNFGQFSYSIPIVVPPGTAGVAPNLGLVYSSASGDGFEGLGWSLTGLPAITRCPRTQTLDSIHGGVNYNADDRFCLNGQRLMQVTGSYGTDGSTYGTYIDGQANIVQHCTNPSCPTGPDWFEVQLKNGTVLQLGNTADSKVLAVGKSVARAWLVNKRTDVKGNYFTVTYTNDATNGQAYPSRIDYTGNATTTPALGTYNSVQFVYGTPDRTDVILTYKAGSSLKITKLLTHIETFNGATMVLDYRLAYEHGSATTHSRLKTLTQCDGAGSCLAPTTFTWQGGTGTLTPTTISNTLTAGAALNAGDFNGDGLTDAMAYSSSCPTGGIVWLGDSAGAFAPGNLTASYHYWKIPGSILTLYSGPLCFPGGGTATGVATVDFNANGLADLFVSQLRNLNDVTDPLVNDGAGNQSEAQSAPAGEIFSLLGDFNGDGRTDGFDAASQKAYFSVGDGTFTADTGHTASAANLTRDFDGDGCTDILQQGATNNIVYYCNPAVATATAPNLTGSTVVPGDFNGDGIADLLAVNGTAALLYLGTGTGFISTPYTISGSSTWHSYKIVAGDWDGDGKTDVALLSQAASSQHLIFLSSGTSFTQVATIATSAAETVTGAVADWNSDGADDLWIQKASGDTEYTFYGTSSPYAPELLIGVNNGLSAADAVGVAYDRLNRNSTFYTKGTSAAYPYLDLNGADYVVSQVTYNNGVGGSYHTSYAYTGAVVDVTAPPMPGPKWNLTTGGLLTFTNITATNSRTGLVTTTTYRTDLPFAGLMSAQTTTNGAGGQTVGSVSDSYTNVARGQANGVRRTAHSVSTTDLDGAAIFSLSTQYLDFDGYSNPLWVRQTWADSSRRETHNTFNNETLGPWILGQITASTVEGILGTSDITRTFSFTPDAATGFTTARIAEPSSSTMKLETDYGYDPFGNLNSVTQSGSSTSSRTTGAQYDGSGTFPATVTDALTNVTNLTFDPKFGGQASVTDPNSIQTSMIYDTFGRPSFGTKPDTNKVSIGYAYCSGVNGGTAACPANGAYVVTTTPETSTSTPTSGTQNGVAIKTVYDALGRPIATDMQGYDGPSTGCTLVAPCWIRTATLYDASGRVHQTSRPYFINGGTAAYTTYAYDVLDRITSVTFPDTTQTTYCYHGITTSTTNAAGQIKVVTRNAHNLVATVIDGASGDCLASSPTGTKTTYTYDAFDNPLTITDNSGHAIANTFDTRGRQTGMSDPDMGSWTFSYDALNELTGQTDAKLQNTAITYDKLMRPATRTEADLFSKWTYDGRPHGIGQIANGCLNTTCSAGAFWLQPSYDAYGRPSQDQQKIDGSTYNYNVSYNSDGRIDTITYPSNFVAKYVYTALGYLQQIKDNTTSAVLWTANASDAELRLTQQTAGNGVITSEGFDAETGNLASLCASTNAGPCDGNVAGFTYSWDDIGNLTTRADAVAGKTEHFCYDGLSRVVSAKITVLTLCPQSGGTQISYDSLGNITKKSDVCSTANCFAYGGSGAGPHQLTSIVGTYNGVTNPSFAYDANGNMTGGGGRTVGYTSFNKAGSLANGAATQALVYGPWHGRYKMCAPDCTTPTTTTTYLADPFTGTYSEKVVSGATTTWRDYIVAGGQIVALRTKTGSTTAMLYLVSDHLGSTAIVSDTATPVNIERDSYDAWGRRRNANGTADPTCSLTSQTNRGYTSQEMLDSQCLINMNARIYDPTLGRFQSADTVVPDPTDTQSFNRYSYVTNNPLAFVDPSGNATLKCTSVDGGPETCAPIGLEGAPGGGGNFPGGNSGNEAGNKDAQIDRRLKGKKLCDPNGMFVGNTLTSAGRIFERGGVAIAGAGALGLAYSGIASAFGGAPGAVGATGSAGLFLTGMAGITIGGNLTLTGQFIQGMSGGSWAPFNQSAGVAGATALIPEPLSIITDFTVGLMDAADTSSNQQTCPAK